MDTFGHEETAKSVGYPLLSEAFEPHLVQPRLNAFYLGNWLTDLSQAIDPTIGPLALEKAQDRIDQMMDWVLGATYFNNGPIFKRLSEYLQLEETLQEIHLETHLAVEALINQVLKPKGTDEKSLWHQFAQAGILLRAYFKFVHPESNSSETHMFNI